MLGFDEMRQTLFNVRLAAHVSSFSWDGFGTRFADVPLLSLARTICFEAHRVRLNSVWRWNLIILFAIRYISI